MPKKPRWICLEPMCGHIVSSKPTGGPVCGCFLWCGREKYLLPDEIEIPRPCIHLGYVDLSGPDCHVQLTGEGMMRAIRKSEARRAAAARSGHLDWQQPVDDDDVLDALWRAMRGRWR